MLRQYKQAVHIVSVKCNSGHQDRDLMTVVTYERIGSTGQLTEAYPLFPCLDPNASFDSISRTLYSLGVEMFPSRNAAILRSMCKSHEDAIAAICTSIKRFLVSFLICRSCLRPGSVLCSV